jgi:hypothetical protein
MPYQVFEWLAVAEGFELTREPLSEAPGGSLMWTSLDVGDVNRDGAPDFVVAEPGGGGRLCWYENPAGSSAPSPTAGPGSPSPTPPGGSPSPTPGPGSPSPTGPASPSPSPTATRPPGLVYRVLLPLAVHRR